MLKRTIGRLVLVATAVFGIWFTVSHYHGRIERFGCPAGSVVAHADSADCPIDIDAAAADAPWAADRIATIAGAKLTTGLFYDVDGHETHFVSGREDISARIDAFLENTGAAAMPPSGGFAAADHVEAKAAMTMRENHVDKGVLVINNPGGPCPGPYSCRKVIVVLLRPGAALTVWWPGGVHETFTGRS